MASGAKVFGFVDRSYWLDIGNPAALLKASRDLVFEMNNEFLALPEANIAPNAVLGGGAVIGRRSRVEAGAHVDGSIVGDDAVIGAGASLKNCFVAAGFEVPAHVIAVDNYFGF